MTVSICIPTFERAALLNDTLERFPTEIDAEIVVSDNCSRDETAVVVGDRISVDPRIRYTCLPENRGTSANLRNAVQHATGELIVYLADDDSLLAEPLAVLCGRMDSDPSLSAIFCDHQNWDDAQQCELHRYFPANFEAIEFENDPLGFVNFLLETRIPPEIGIVRRDAFLKAQVPIDKETAMEFHLWAYGYSRLGKVRFDPTCYYREHWVLKPHLQRTHWCNQEMAKAYAGDQMRVSLQNMLRLALRDYGYQTTYCVPRALDLIEHTILQRSVLECHRALQRGDLFTCVELRRWQALHGIPAGEGFDEQLAVEAGKKAYEMYGEGDKPSLQDLVTAYRV